MPYTTVTAGTTITAAWANTNVRDQVVTPFASKAALLSAITSPVNGMYATTTDTGWTWRYNGTKWMITDAMVLVTNSHGWTSTTTYTLLDNTDTTPNGGLQWAVEANCRYEWALDLHIQANSSVALAAQLLYPTGGSADVAYLGAGFTGTFAAGGTQGIASAATIATFGGTGGTSLARLHGQVATAGTAGNAQFGFAQGASSAATSFVLLGTALRFRQVG